MSRERAEELREQAGETITRFLSANYPCGCVDDSDCPGEAPEAQVLLDQVRPILHRERDELDHAEFAERFAHRFPEATLIRRDGNTVEDLIFESIEAAVRNRVASEHRGLRRIFRRAPRTRG